MTEKIRVLLADDHAVVRQGIRRFLEEAPDIAVAAEAEDGAEAVRLTGLHRPDVVVLDIRMPKVTSVEAARRIQEHFPEVRVLALTAYDDDPYVFALLQAGADGYVMKTASADESIEAVGTVYRGESALSPEIASKVVRQATRRRPEGAADQVESLTERELDVLRMVAKGVTNREVGRELGISHRTVQGHLASIYGKLNGAPRKPSSMLHSLHTRLVEEVTDEDRFMDRSRCRRRGRAGRRRPGRGMGSLGSAPVGCRPPVYMAGRDGGTFNDYCRDWDYRGGRGMMGRRRAAPDLCRTWGSEGSESQAPDTSAELIVEKAHEAVEAYLVAQGYADLEVAEVMAFERNFYAIAQEPETGMGAMELLIDRETGAVGPEMGPNMMWNARYGMHAHDRTMAGTREINALSPDEAVEVAQRWLDGNRPGLSADKHAYPFYGYYTIHTLEDSRIEGMLSVHGTTGQVEYHNWHGAFLQMTEHEDDH